MNQGHFASTPAQQAEASGLARWQTTHVMILEHTLLEFVRSLEERGIPSRVLKGAALAQSVYPDPSLRLYVDIDVLVPSSRFDDVARMLASSGANRARPEPRPGFVARFAKAASFQRPDGIWIDLHRTLLDGPFSFRMDNDALFRSATPFEVGGHQLHGLGPEERFIHACCHAGLGDIPPKSLPLRDVVQTLRAPDFDEAHARALWEHWGLGAIVARAVDGVWSAFGLQADTVSAWASSYEPRRRDKDLVDLYFSRDVDVERRNIVATLREISGLAPRLSYLRAMLLPTKEYRAAHEQHRLRRGLEVLLRRPSRRL